MSDPAMSGDLVISDLQRALGAMGHRALFRVAGGFVAWSWRCPVLCEWGIAISKAEFADRYGGLPYDFREPRVPEDEVAAALEFCSDNLRSVDAVPEGGEPGPETCSELREFLEALRAAIGSGQQCSGTVN